MAEPHADLKAAGPSATATVSPVAEVVVNTPVSRAGGYDASSDIFSYEIPPLWQGQIEPGHLVWAPFSGRRLQGIVVGLAAAAPPGVTLRPLDELAAAEPVLSPAHLELARWMSQRYLAPLRDCLFVMLPAGVAQRVDVVLARQGAGPLPDDLSAEQRSLLLRLQRSDAAQRVLKKENPAWGQSRVLQPLLQRGLLTRRSAVTSPTVRPQVQPWVRLLADAATIGQMLPTLGRRSKQADALAMLARQTPPALTMDALQKLAGCGAGPLQALAARGWISIAPGPEAAARLVTLNLPPAEVNAHLVGLRGGEKYQRVLTALQEAGEPLWIGRVQAEADVDAPTVRELAAAGLIALEQVEVMRDPLAGRTFEQQSPPLLTAEQQNAWEAIEATLGVDQPTDAAARAAGRFFLLFGVTGSGKTEIYLRAIATALAHGKQAIVLVPEIALTPQTINRFAVRFPNQIAVWHSDLSPGERFDAWRRMRRGELRVVIGPRSALFAPLPNLGVIIVDEEHDSSYKEHERQPRYQARAVALRLAQLTGATVILGSATPSLETFYAAQRGQLQLLAMPSRVMGHQVAAVTPDAGPLTIELPEVSVVDLRQELRAGNRSVLSRALQDALRQTLDAGEQAILFLNRRGNATVVMCRDCGYVEKCSRCELPMTYHGPLAEAEQPILLESAPPGGQRPMTPFLLCHQCNRRRPVPTTCPACGSVRIRYLGAGTQRIEQEVRDLFPQARPLRWDRDTTQHKGAHADILERFSTHQANVLIGTQMIAKGLDLPMVTLVGVISADVGLYLPDLRAAEHTFQVLMQVAGRAGRSVREGRVIIQTYTPDHYTVQAASQHDYVSFFRRELDYRRQLDYPPLTRLVRLVYSHSNAERAEAETQRVARLIQAEISRLGMSDVGVIGPAPCFFARLRYRYRWHILLRGRGHDPAAIVRPLSLPPGWHVDVDPLNLL